MKPAKMTAITMTSPGTTRLSDKKDIVAKRNGSVMNIRAGVFSLPGEGATMEKQEMTIEELREYIKTLPDNVIVRVTVMEGDDGSSEREAI